MRKTLFSRVLGLCFLAISNLVFANSGVYNNILVGVDPRTGIITGAFHEERNPPIGPSYSCIFAFKGSTKEKTISARFPGDEKSTRGEIRFLDLPGKKGVFLKLNEQQPGCQQATAFNFLKGDVLELTTIKPWIAVMIVTAKKTYFYDSPDTKKKRRGYVVYSDCVGILEIVNNWVKVEYINGNRSLIGWLQLQDLGGL